MTLLLLVPGFQSAQTWFYTRSLIPRQYCKMVHVSALLSLKPLADTGLRLQFPSWT